MDPLTPGSGRFSGLSLPEIYQPAEPCPSAVTEVIKDVAKGGNWCGGKDSNLHGIATASPSSWCVCQFRHHRIKLNRCFCLLLGSGSPREVAVAFSGFDCPAILRKSNQNCITHFARRETSARQRLRLRSLRGGRRAPRSCRRSLLWSRRRGLRRRRFRSWLGSIVNYGASLPSRTIRPQRQSHREDHEHHCAPGCRLGKYGCSAARTECRLATRTTERSGQVSRLAALQQYHYDQHQAVHYEKRGQHPGKPAVISKPPA